MTDTMRMRNAEGYMSDIFNLFPKRGIRIIRSGLGNSRFVGTAIPPKRFIDDARTFLHDARDGNLLAGSRLVRVNMKVGSDGCVCPVGISEQPCGFGVLRGATHLYYRWRRNGPYSIDGAMRRAGIVLRDTVVLYSPGRSKDGVCRSDDALFSDHVLPWESEDAPYSVNAGNPVIIRSTAGETVPDPLRTTLIESDNLIMPYRADNRRSVMGSQWVLGIFLLRRYEGETMTDRVRNALIHMCDSHGVDAAVISPAMDGSEVRTRRLNREQIGTLTPESSCVRDIERSMENPGNTLYARPYTAGFRERETGISNGVGIFFARSKGKPDYFPICGHAFVNDGAWNPDADEGDGNMLHCLLEI